MAPIRVGVVGIGFGQHVHVPAFRADARCQVTAICASTPERAARAAASLTIPLAFGDWRTMIEHPDIDVISIAVPPSVQPEIAISAIERGKAVFCEKPLAVSLAAAHEMNRAAERAGAANMVDFQFPETDEWRQAKTIVDTGGVGAVRHVAVSWNVETYSNRMRLTSWKADSEAGGGALYSFVSHTLHYLEWFAGQIRGLSARLSRAPGDTRPADTLAILCAEFESGAVASVTVNSDAMLGSGHRVDIYGDAGTLVLDNNTRDYINGFSLRYGTRAAERLEVLSSSTPAQPEGQDGRIAATSRLVRRFLDSCELGVRGAPSFAEGLRVQSLLDMARRSNESGEWVWVQRPS